MNGRDPRRGPGSALILAGTIVTLVGLSVALVAALGLPRHWTTVGVGLALLVAGAARRAFGARDES